MSTFHCKKWPGCDCPDGTVSADCPGLLDRRNVIVHPPIEGENLERERYITSRPFPFTPFESFAIVAVTLAALAAVVVAL